jgi:CheY-like chemotaxis protein
MPRVLIIDDESGIRFALRRWFDRQQWAVLEAEDGHKALERLAEADRAGDAIDVIICDLHLPGLTGEQLIEQLRVSHPALVSRVVLTTGDAVDDASPGSILAEHPHVLQKPFDLTTLRTLLASLLGSRPGG